MGTDPSRTQGDLPGMPERGLPVRGLAGVASSTTSALPGLHEAHSDIWRRLSEATSALPRQLTSPAAHHRCDYYFEADQCLRAPVYVLELGCQHEHLVYSTVCASHQPMLFASFERGEPTISCCGLCAYVHGVDGQQLFLMDWDRC